MNMKNYICLLLLCFCLAGCGEKARPVVVETAYLPIADPYVMSYGGKYYAYGTGGTVEGRILFQASRFVNLNPFFQCSF